MRIRSYSGPHFSHIFPYSDSIRRNVPYHSIFTPNVGKCGKNADQNNSEYGHFLRSVTSTDVDWTQPSYSKISIGNGLGCFFLFSYVLVIIVIILTRNFILGVSYLLQNWSLLNFKFTCCKNHLLPVAFEI